MYRQMASVSGFIRPKTGRALSISNSSTLADKLGLTPTEMIEVSYPEHNILSLDFPDNHFDFVLSDMVLEHVEGNPQAVVDECRRILKPGGTQVMTSCLIDPIHAAPHDFWRFTPDGLSLLHRGWSEIIECGGWGNFDVWSIVNDGMRFAGVPHATWHPMHKVAMRNDPAWPIVTWIIAKK